LTHRTLLVRTAVPQCTGGSQRNADERLNTDNDPSTSYRNLVSLGAVTQVYDARRTLVVDH